MVGVEWLSTPTTNGGYRARDEPTKVAAILVHLGSQWQLRHRVFEWLQPDFDRQSDHDGSGHFDNAHRVFYDC